ncbi:MAG: hypothetical protein QOF62_3493 [Pyrinomonadaceae bacterium]|jgi:hypothetical protein|nr:hypothetical protein [Pyrinomonadaceae bacterium]
MALQGSLNTMGVSDLLQFLAVSRKTGLLKFSQQKVLKGIYFENGIIVGSSTNDPKEYLGQVLIHYGKIDEAQLQVAMEIQRGEAAVPSPMSKVQSQGNEVSISKSQVSSNPEKQIPDSKFQSSAATEVSSSTSQVSNQTQKQIPDSRFQIPDSKSQVPDSRSQISDPKLVAQTLVGGEHRLKSMPQKPRRLGQILVADGILSDAQVSQLLEIRTLDIIYDLFLWKEGHFEFVSEGPLPADFTRVRVEANRVVMEGIHRADEMARFRTLIPSDRTLLELGAGWTSSLPAGKATRQLLYFLEKRMSVAEICYNMHSSAFEVYAQLFELVKDGVVHVVGELPETPDPASQMPDLPDAAADLLLLARSELNNDEAEKSLSIIHTVLGRDPKNTAAHTLLAEAEKKFIDRVYAEISPSGVPKVLVQLEDLANKEIGSQEGFVLSRINGVWDIQSILSICPFREADSLSLIKKLWDNGIIGF